MLPRHPPFGERHGACLLHWVVMLRWYLACVGLGAGAAVLLLAGARSAGWLRSTPECVAAPAPKGSAPGFAFLREGSGRAGVEELRKRLAAAQRVVFRSNDGIAYRSDDDWEITFGPEPERAIDILYFGLSGEYYAGKYQLSEDGRVTLQGPIGADFPQLPELVLQARHGGLFLVPFTLSPDPVRDETWYFRMLTGDDEQEALSDLRAAQGRRQ